jgi:hypothetical protein
VYTMSDRYKSDSNVTIDVLQRVLKELEERHPGKRLPRKLYVQMDNCVRENKNKYVLGYLSWLVQRGVFEEIQLSFLPVGHTHEDIDQMFSRIAKQLRSNNAVDLEQLQGLVTSAFLKYGVRPEFRTIDSIAHTSGWIETHLNAIHGHADRNILHYQILPHADGAMLKSKGRCDLPWDSYDTASGGFHLLKSTVPRCFSAADRPVSAPLKIQETSRLDQMGRGLEKLKNDPRLSQAALLRLWKSLELLRDTTPSAFAWKDDGRFAYEMFGEQSEPLMLSAAAAASAEQTRQAIERDREVMMGDEDDLDLEEEAEPNGVKAAASTPAAQPAAKYGHLMNTAQAKAAAASVKKAQDADLKVTVLNVDDIIVVSRGAEAASTDKRRFWLGRVLTIDRLAGDITFVWLTPWALVHGKTSKAKSSRRKVPGGDFDGYLPDLEKGTNSLSWQETTWEKVLYYFRRMDRDPKRQCYLIPPSLHAILNTMFADPSQPPIVRRSLDDPVLKGPPGTLVFASEADSRIDHEVEIKWTDGLGKHTEDTEVENHDASSTQTNRKRVASQTPRRNKRPAAAGTSHDDSESNDD